MYKNRASNGSANICGARIAELRKNIATRVSQKVFADMLQLAGIDVDKNAIQRIECGKRFVTDIELKAIAQILNVTVDELLK